MKGNMKNEQPKRLLSVTKSPGPVYQSDVR